jgi:peptidase E
MRVLVVDAFLPTKRGREASAAFVDQVRAVLNPLDVQVRAM